MLVASPSPGPGVAVECQPNTGILALLAALMVLACSVASTLPSTMALGLLAMAWLIALVCPWAVPRPSYTSTVQPSTVAASLSPTPTPFGPPSVRSAAT
jgi:hypothetical protein